MARLETDLPLPFCPKEAAALWDFVYLYGELPSMSDTEYIPAVGPGTENPWSMSWAKVQQLWNKPALLTFAGSMDVREYDLDAEEVIDRTITFDTAAYEATLSITPIKRFTGSKYIHESGLVCPINYISIVANSTGVEDSEDAIAVSLNWWVPAEGAEDNAVAQLHKFDGDFYPQFRVVFEVFTKNGVFYIAKTVVTPDEVDLGIYTTHTDKLIVSLTI